jgi:hypothetical protein
MICRLRLWAAGFAVCAACLAWQGGIAMVGLSDAEAEQVARSFFGSSSLSLPGPYFLKGPMAAQWKGKAPAERAQAVREMALYAKRMVSSPAFAATYNGWIKDRYHAADHGLKLDPRADATKMAANPDSYMKQMQNTIAAGLSQSFSQMPVSSLKMLFDQDLKSWNADKGKAKLSARAQQIAPMITRNPEEFKKQYILLKSIDMGGPDSLAGLEAAKADAQKAQTEQKAREEQQAWNEHRLPVEIKRRLTEFVTIARSVDFAAQTRPQNGRLVFVSQDYERKSDNWKRLYRLGKEPTQAMLSVAEQWLKDLP